MRSRLLALALAAHAFLAGGYLLATPVFEAPDELGHFLYVRHLLETRSLPLVQASSAALGEPGWRESTMGHHPPLYYALLAGTQAALGDPDVAPTPHRRLRPDGEVDRDVWMWNHGHDERSPISGEVRTFRWLRLGSVVLGLATLVLVHRLGRLAFPEAPRIADGATLLLACWPQWSFVHGALDNGNLAELLCHGAYLLLALALVRRGIGPAGGLLLGGVVGLALCTKLTALFLLPLTALVLALGAWRWPRRGRTLAAAGAFLAVVALLAGWTFVRNLDLYGDLLGAAAHRRAFAGNLLAEDRRAFFLLHRFPTQAFRTLVASFGWGGLKAPELVYELVRFAAVGAVLGWLVRGRRLVQERAVLLLLVVAAALVFAGLLRFNLVFRQPQGRYLFPASGPLALLLVAGLAGLGGRFAPALGRHVARAAFVLLPAGAAALLIGHVAPGLAPPPRGGPHDAVLVRGLRTPAQPDRATLRPIAPPEGALLETAPVFVWSDPAASPEAGDVLYSVHLIDERGRGLGASFERWGIELVEGRFALPEEAWDLLPRGETVRWKVRRVPDRRVGEGVEDVAESPPLTFRVAR